MSYPFFPTEKVSIVTFILFCKKNSHGLFRYLSVGNWAALSKFHGVQRKETSIIVAEDFIFDKYSILHEIGHVFGCSHEKPPKDSPKYGNPGKYATHAQSICFLKIWFEYTQIF